MSRGAQKPTSLRALEGGRSHSLPKPDAVSEPKPAAVAPRKPHGLDADGRYVWSKLAPVLLPLGLLTEADGELFATLCQTAARQEQIREAIKAEEVDGKLVLMKTTIRFFGRDNSVEEPIVNPLLIEERKNAELLRKLANDFGMSPRGRAGLVIGDGEDGGEELLD